MEKFEISDEIFKQMQEEAVPATPEEIAKRPQVSNDSFEAMPGDKTARILAREGAIKKLTEEARRIA